MQVAAPDPRRNASKDRKFQVLIGPRLKKVLSKALTRLVQKGCTQRRFFVYLFRLSTFTIIHTLPPVSVTSAVTSVQQVITHQTAFCFPESERPHGTREWAPGEMGAHWVRPCTCSCRGQRTVSSACQGFVADLPCDPGSRTGLFWESASRL